MVPLREGDLRLALVVQLRAVLGMGSLVDLSAHGVGSLSVLQVQVLSSVIFINILVECISHLCPRFSLGMAI